LPKVNEITDFKKFIRFSADFKGQKFIAHCDNESTGRSDIKMIYSINQNVLVLIGPEGDFSADEVKLAKDNGFEEISLGSSRLRTETAALYACTVINALNE